MANLYARDTALNNVSGRSKYISDEKRQEEIVLHEKNMKFTWQDYSNFEANNQKSSNKNIEARETVIALPNELYQDKQKLKNFCDDLAKLMYGINRDYEYAVHWNKARTNLHVHFIYSEREINLKATPKRYKRDLWVNSKTGKTCSKNSSEAILRCKKGDIQRDSAGNIKYDNSPFTVKDKKYNNKNWLNERNKLIKRVFDKYKFKIHVFDKSQGFIPQKKLYKGAREDYELWANFWNKGAKNYNNKLIQLREKKENFKKYIKANDYIEKYDKEYSKAFRRKVEMEDYGFLGKMFYKLFYKKRDDIISNSLDRAFSDRSKYFDENFQTFNYIEDAKNEYERIENQLIQFKKNLYEKWFNVENLFEYINKEKQKELAKEKELKEKYPEMFEENLEYEYAKHEKNTNYEYKQPKITKNKVKSRDDYEDLER